MTRERIINSRRFRRYWQIRNSGDPSERRSDAHNELIDALDAAGIRYKDREDAAQIGRELLDAQNSVFVYDILMIEQVRFHPPRQVSYATFIVDDEREEKNLEGE